MPSSISYLDEGWAVVTGCSAVSKACEGCWAAYYAANRGRHLPAYQGLARLDQHGRAQWTGEVRLHPDKLELPWHWYKPRTIGVAFTGDLFHEEVPDNYIDRTLAIMALTPWHQYLILTKRPERMLPYMAELVKGPWAGRIVRDGIPEVDVTQRVFQIMMGLYFSIPPQILNRAADWWAERNPDGLGFLQAWPLPNVWLGVTVENQEQKPRIDLLRQAPAAKRWLSLEPLLEDLGGLNLDGISWCVVGSESGPNARPMQLDWVRAVRDKCVAAGTKFYFKQAMDSGKLIHLPTLDGLRWEEKP